MYFKKVRESGWALINDFLKESVIAQKNVHTLRRKADKREKIASTPLTFTPHKTSEGISLVFSGSKIKW